MILVEGFNNRQNQAIALAIKVQDVLMHDIGLHGYKDRLIDGWMDR